MKFLMIFVDMLRPNLLNMGNKRIRDTELDKVLKPWNGTFYSNCFTPGPDTPRSTACLWSSLYPIKNGCNTRIRYPYFYLREPENNFLTLLKKNGYKMNFVINVQNEQLGELPVKFSEDCYYEDGTLEERLKRVEVTDNSFTYISIQDYHAVVNDWHASPRAAVVGNELVAREIRMIESVLPLNQFDCVILYSDHGWKKGREPMDTPLQRLGRNRTQIMCYVAEKNQNEYRTDKRLCSIMDLGPTICEMAGIDVPYETDGMPLQGSKQYKRILIEDPVNFKVTIGQTIEVWGVRGRNGLACCASNGRIEADYDISGEEEEDVQKFISENGSYYKENHFQQEILDKYREVDNILTYYDGTLRKDHLTLKSKVKQNINNILHKMNLG